MASVPQIAWKPHAGPQTWLITCPVLDILTGGARGGGKTQGMIGRVLQRQQTYGKNFRGIWLRRSQPEIEGAQLEMLKIFPLVGAVYEAQARTWRFPAGGTLKLRYLESDIDATRYQGHEYTDVYVDDAGTWPTPVPLDFMRGTLRSSAGVPCAIILSANPCGPGHEWLKARYLTPSVPLRPFWSGDGPARIQRVFIPSKLSDNPSLYADPAKRDQYIANLHAAGPDHIVRAWLDGDWDVEPDAAMIQPQWLEFTWDELPTVRGRHRIICSVDPAEDVGSANDETGIVIGAVIDGKRFLLWQNAVKLLLEPLEALLERLAVAFNVTEFVIEKKSVGGPLAQNLKRRPGWRWPVNAIDPGSQSKAERMWAQVPWLSSGAVLLPSKRAQNLQPMECNWADYKRELTRFTGNKKLKERDNRVDATSQLLRYVGDKPNLRALFTA